MTYLDILSYKSTDIFWIPRAKNRSQIICKCKINKFLGHIQDNFFFFILKMKTIWLKCSRLKTVHTLYNTLYDVVYINRGDRELHKMRNGACGIIIMVSPKNRVKHTRCEYNIRLVSSHISHKADIKIYNMFHGYKAI